MYIRTPASGALLPLPTNAERVTRNREPSLAQVLFDHLEVPAVTVVNGAGLALAACGVREGLVIDIGFVSTRVIPVLHGQVVRSALQSCQIGGTSGFWCKPSSASL